MAVASTSFMTLNNCDFVASSDFGNNSVSQNLSQINKPTGIKSGAGIKSD
jgi:hypothetical protein